MKTISPFQAEPWARIDWLVLAALVCLSALVLGAGLSIRPLWGPEGRWAVIVREMLQSGNYLLPTVNGVVYFEKPLLSYWAILPFTWVGGLNEAMLRMPSVLSGVGTVLITFFIGRRLFGRSAGIIASLFLMTTGMFVVWARTASADLLNLFSIWFMFWCFLAGGWEGKLKHLVAVYSVGALSSFFKGPVAPAVTFFALALYSSTSLLLEIRGQAASGNTWRWEALRATFCREFRWLVSRQALFAILTGVAIGFFLLFLPVLVTGSWVSMELMWRENVIRFVQPFDHIQAAHGYATHMILFTAPWTLLIAAAIWETRRWGAGQSRRWLTLVTLAIFLFFALSKSRRGYYLLPIVPALALFAGRALSDGLGAMKKNISWTMRAATAMTSCLMLIAGLAATGIYSTLNEYHTPSVVIVAGCAIGGGCSALWLLSRRNFRKGLVVVLSLIFVLELWVFTKGMQFAEQKNTLRSYSKELAACLANVDDENIAVFHENAALLFYLNRKHVHELNSVDDLSQFKKEHPDGFIIADLADLDTHGEMEYVDGMAMVLLQQKNIIRQQGERFALLKVGAEETLVIPPIRKVPTRWTDLALFYWRLARASQSPLHPAPPSRSLTAPSN